VIIAIDKKAHFLAGAAIAASVALYSTPLIGVSACLIIGAGKELYDMTGRGTPDIWDFIATACGSVVVLPLIVL